MRFDHVGIVVRRIADAERLLTENLGFTFDRSLSIPGRLRAVFLRCGDAGVELIEIEDSAERERRLGDMAARIEHIAIQVVNVEAVMKALQGSGVETTTVTPVVNGPTRSYVTLPRSSAGITIQAFETVENNQDG